MTALEKFKSFLFRKVAAIIREMRLYKLFNLKNDQRPNASFKLVFFCGKSGIKYLNASLFSVYRSWKFLPEILIVSDGTSLGIFKEKLVKWPRKVEIISWEEPALYYRHRGNLELYNIATTKRWPGKKFVSLLYLAEKSLILYSDTDVLWFSSPNEIDVTIQPIIKMGKDVGPFYTSYVLNSLQEKQPLFNTSFNSGIMYLKGSFSSYPKWTKMCNILETNPDTDNFAEQTAFAILNNHFNEKKYWSENDILIKIDDTYKLKYTKKQHPHILARHYVSTKGITFWRDFAYMCLGKLN